MASFLNRMRTAASSATSSAASTSSASSYNSFLKRALYQNPIMSVSVVLGTVGMALPFYVYVTDGPRQAHSDGPSRLKPYIDQLGQLEEERKQKILRATEKIHGNPRVDALREHLQTSAKFAPAQPK